MYKIDSLVCEFQQIPKDKKKFSPVIRDIASKNLILFAKIFRVQCDSVIYKKLLYNAYDIPLSVSSTLQSIYDLHRRIWERSWYLIHILNTVRVMQGRMHAQPEADNFFRVTRVDEVLQCTQQVIKENSHFDLDENHSKLLEVSLINYYLRQIDYPSVIGDNIVSDSLTEEALEKDLTKSLKMWLKIK